MLGTDEAAIDLSELGKCERFVPRPKLKADRCAYHRYA